MARILIADDDVILIEMLRFRLEAAGHLVDVVYDGKAALDRAIELVPDLIVIDAMMPVLSGLDLVTRLKADPKLASIPVVMLTARKGGADISAALDRGVDAYLTKPFVPHELLRRIESLLMPAEGAGE